MNKGRRAGKTRRRSGLPSADPRSAVPTSVQREEAALSEQLSEDAYIAAAQVLSMGATRYAGALITAAIGDPLPGSNVLAALAHARQSLGPAVNLPAPVASALLDLQVVAVIFTVQWAAGALESLPGIEDKLVTVLKQDTARIHARDCAVAAQGLSDRALDYMHQIIFAEDNRVPIGTDAVEHSLTELHIAAVVFTTQLAIAESYDPAPLRRIEDKLVAAFADYGGS